MRIRIISTIIVGVILATVGVAVAQTVDEPDRIDVDQEPVGLDAPTSLQQVLVVDIQLEDVEPGAPVGTVEGTEEIASPAPKVFARQGGEWRVDLATDPPRSFFVNNPRWLEAEPDPETGDRVSVLNPDPRWRLVIPLYLDGEPLDFDFATVVNAATEEVIVEIER